MGRENKRKDNREKERVCFVSSFLPLFVSAGPHRGHKAKHLKIKNNVFTDSMNIFLYFNYKLLFTTIILKRYLNITFDWL